MTEAAASRPRYASNQSVRTSPYFDHQPGALACRASDRMPARTCSSVTLYRVSRSATSRSLTPTRPFSMRLILDRDARISYPAASGVTPAASRKRCSWLPSIMRSTVEAKVSAGGSPPGETALILAPGPMDQRSVPAPTPNGHYGATASPDRQCGVPVGRYHRLTAPPGCHLGRLP